MHACRIGTGGYGWCKYVYLKKFGSKCSLKKTEGAQKGYQSSRKDKLSGRQSFFRHFKGTSSREEYKPIFSDLILWNNGQFV